MTDKRTHYTWEEAGKMLKNCFPDHSAMVFLHVKNEHNICFIKAGTQLLITIAELDRYIKAIESTPVMKKEGFLVIQEISNQAEETPPINGWKLQVGQEVTWRSTARGSNKRSGKIIAQIPSHTSASAILGDYSKSKDTQDRSSIDRYAVVTPKLNAKKQPIEGKAIVMLPNRFVLEKAMEEKDNV